jgi:hypothetical protein
MKYLMVQATTQILPKECFQWNEENKTNQPQVILEQPSDFVREMGF